MIDLAALTSLGAVSRHGSVIAAATSLGYTPSAVSQQIKRLERSVGVDLLERVGRGVILTEAGRQLVDEGGDVLTELERLQSDLRAGTGQVAGRLRLAAFATAVRGLLAPAVGALHRSHPDLQVTLVEREPWDTIALVASGEADVGLVHSWGDVPLEIPDHLSTAVVTHDVADVLVPADHPLAARDRVTPQELLDVRWVATPEGTICRAWLVRMYVGTGQAPRIAHESMEFASHVALVAAGLGVALVPRLGREALPAEVRAVAVTDPVPTREISLLHRRSMDRSPAVRAIAEQISAAVG